MAATYENCTIFVDYTENEMYTVSVLGYLASEPDAEPDDAFDSSEFERKKDAMADAKAQARHFVDSGQAEASTVLDDGNDVYYYDGKKGKGKRSAKKNPQKFGAIYWGKGTWLVVSSMGDIKAVKDKAEAKALALAWVVGRRGEVVVAQSVEHYAGRG